MRGLARSRTPGLLLVGHLALNETSCTQSSRIGRLYMYFFTPENAYRAGPCASERCYLFCLLFTYKGMDYAQKLRRMCPSATSYACKLSLWPLDVVRGNIGRALPVFLVPLLARFVICFSLAYCVCRQLMGPTPATSDSVAHVDQALVNACGFWGYCGKELFGISRRCRGSILKAT